VLCVSRTVLIDLFSNI